MMDKPALPPEVATMVRSTLDVIAKRRDERLAEACVAAEAILDGALGQLIRFRGHRTLERSADYDGLWEITLFWELVIAPLGIAYYSYRDHPFGERKRNEVEYYSQNDNDATLLPTIAEEILAEVQNPVTTISCEVVTRPIRR